MPFPQTSPEVCCDLEYFVALNKMEAIFFLKNEFVSHENPMCWFEFVGF